MDLVDGGDEAQALTEDASTFDVGLVQGSYPVDLMPAPAVLSKG